MFNVFFFYIGRALQILGMITAAMALLTYFNQQENMGTMMKIAGAGLVEFYVGYGITMLTGRKG
ncbi:MAG: hypothetical protein HY751_07080 [Nitrospinae bacterium]|nr:hypothetical protein [Nitrospinota bacterium]